MSDSRDTHLGLLCDVGDLALRLADSADVPAFLDGIVTPVADRLQETIEHLTLTQCRDHAEAVLAMTSLDDIRAEMEGVARTAEAE